MIKKIKAFIEKNEGLILVLIGAVFLRLPTLIEPNRYADEDIYLTLGEAFKRGWVFYRDIHDNKPPLLYIVAGLAGSVTAFRFVLMIWHLIGVVFFYLLSGKLFEGNRLRLFITALFALLTSIPLLEGNIANGEIFMIVPVIVGVWLLILVASRSNLGGSPQAQKSHLGGVGSLSATHRGGIFCYFLVGVLFAMGFLFKIPVAFEFIGVLFWWLFIKEAKFIDGVKKIFSGNFWMIIVGFAVPILISVVYYATHGAGEVYLRSALMQNIGYLSSWEGESSIWQSELMWRGIVVVVVVMFVFAAAKILGAKFSLVAIWFITALFGALLSGRPYPHYLIEIVPAACLLLALLLQSHFNLLKWLSGFVLFSLLGWSVIHYDFWHYESLGYYQNYLKYVSGQSTDEEYMRYFGGGVIRNYKIAEYIAKRTNRDDLIYVWGTEPAIYDIANRLPVGRFTVAYHVRDFDGFEETMQKIEETPPKFVVWFENEGEFEELRNKLENDYIPVAYFEGATIWKETNLRRFVVK